MKNFANLIKDLANMVESCVMTVEGQFNFNICSGPTNDWHRVLQGFCYAGIWVAYVKLVLLLWGASLTSDLAINNPGGHLAAGFLASVATVVLLLPFVAIAWEISIAVSGILAAITAPLFFLVGGIFDRINGVLEKVESAVEKSLNDKH